MTLNGHFALNSVLRRYVWSSQAWLSKLGFCSECCRRTLNRKEQLRHRAVSCDSFLVHTDTDRRTYRPLRKHNSLVRGNNDVTINNKDCGRSVQFLPRRACQGGSSSVRISQCAIYGLFLVFELYCHTEYFCIIDPI